MQPTKQTKVLTEVVLAPFPEAVQVKNIVFFVMLPVLVLMHPFLYIYNFLKFLLENVIIQLVCCCVNHSWHWQVREWMTGKLLAFWGPSFRLSSTWIATQNTNLKEICIANHVIIFMAWWWLRVLQFWLGDEIAALYFRLNTFYNICIS